LVFFSFKMQCCVWRHTLPFFADEIKKCSFKLRFKFRIGWTVIWKIYYIGKTKLTTTSSVAAIDGWNPTVGLPEVTFLISVLWFPTIYVSSWNFHQQSQCCYKIKSLMHDRFYISSKILNACYLKFFFIRSTYTANSRLFEIWRNNIFTLDKYIFRIFLCSRWDVRMCAKFCDLPDLCSWDKRWNIWIAIFFIIKN
jgi:hypothetical protein